jgi:hypothetical protein
MVASAVLTARPADGYSDCDQTSVGLVPVNDLGAGLYLGQFQGGLYPGGSNTPPPVHHAAGLAATAGIEPLNAAGEPDSEGTIVLASIGMSNTKQEFCGAVGLHFCEIWTFMGQAQVHLDVNHETLVIVNGARSGQEAGNWVDPAQPSYDRIRDDELAPRGLSEAQVQVVWVKVANREPQASLPAQNADAFILLTHLGSIARAVKQRYPNVKSMFVSSRIYAGYTTTPLNPEPFAYESGFSVKWLIEAQIGQSSGGGVDPLAGDLGSDVAPWIGWGPYMWADGLVPRSDGLTWACEDFSNDGIHPGMIGEEKVGSMLIDLFLNSPFGAPWFRKPVKTPLADLDGDGQVATSDLLLLLSQWGCCAECAKCPADLDGDCQVGSADLLILLSQWGS